MYCTYFLHSKSIDKFYIGHTENIELRLTRHNSGWGKFTSKGVPWKLVYYEDFSSKSKAIKRELDIKQRKSRQYIEKLINHAGGRPDSE